MAQLEYVCTKMKTQDEEGRPRTAFRFTAADHGKVLLSVDDVCGSEARARELEGLFRRNQVSPIHALDVLEDWLARD